MKILNFNNRDNKLTVSLTANTMNRGQNFYRGRVVRDTVSMDTIIARMSEENSGVNRYMVLNVAGLLKTEIVKALKRGQAVDILELGTLYLALSGAVSGKVPDSATMPALTAKFSSSRALNEELSTLSVQSITYSNTQPQVDVVTNLAGGTDGFLTPGKPARVDGKHLKVSGTGCGIFFVPVEQDAEHTPVADETQWVRVDMATVFTNRPRRLEFIVPDALPAGMWRLVLRTAYCNGREERKEVQTGVSDVLEVKAE